jgi:hypothetical protein
MICYLGMLYSICAEQYVLESANWCTEVDAGFARNNLRILTDDTSTQMMPTRDNIVSLELNGHALMVNHRQKLA